MSVIEKNLKKLRDKIETAASKVGRESSEVKLVAVTKGRSCAEIEELIKLGVTDLAESRVQELRDKYLELAADINWHMIGHLQRNKVKYIARMENCNLIHSLDSFRLAKRINKRAEMENRILNTLVQVNIAKDENKFGLMPEKLKEYLKEISVFEHLQVKGLMTMVPYVDDPEEVRDYFKGMKELFEEIKIAAIPGVEMQELSMGISNDYQVAIEEGATMVRIGSAIFGPRKY
ncbi:YggS family pyridoxal phosphate-dependent enzyme [Fuchsiella alkaliacetigena]|uniref:YggS family pyridoxal phosphate-dependent enzyme n=1 Tax=Fuchsiella alkaliacetigena TaxID=957042 RepID=UPI00200A40F8|nr:YggS family pyridoxal phosphate-dependent enzyme [Fuchsiella alkaliacetigena]MCK8823699.1 YggS family pyridoxal phosphate-dependent enzyme [Fuchsiella alkaliacetigena]